jgi:hypothetical protein
VQAGSDAQSQAGLPLLSTAVVAVSDPLVDADAVAVILSVDGKQHSRPHAPDESGGCGHVKFSSAGM